MKKKLLAIALVLMTATAALAFQPTMWCVPSSEITSSGSVASPAGYFFGMTVVTDGSNTVKMEVLDSCGITKYYAANGANLTSTITFPASPDLIHSIQFDTPVAYSSGMFASSITAGTYTAIFYYRER